LVQDEAENEKSVSDFQLYAVNKQLHNLKQHGGVEEYTKAFNQLVA